MRSVKTIVLIALCSFTATARAQAQNSSAVPLRDALHTRVRVRIAGAPDYVTGELEAFSDSTIIVRERGTSLSLPAPFVVAAEASRGKPHQADNALWGGLAGAFAGLYIGHRAGGDANDEAHVFTSVDYPVVGVLAGIAVGAGIGAIVSKEHWRMLKVR